MIVLINYFNAWCSRIKIMKAWKVRSLFSDVQCPVAAPSKCDLRILFRIGRNPYETAMIEDYGVKLQGWLDKDTNKAGGWDQKWF